MSFWSSNNDDVQADTDDYNFTDYESNTNDPAWWFSAAVIGVCVVVNATLPLWLAAGKCWDKSTLKKMLRRRKQKKQQQKQDLHRQLGKSIGDSGSGGGENDDNETDEKGQRVTVPMEMFDVASHSKTKDNEEEEDDDDDDNKSMTSSSAVGSSVAAGILDARPTPSKGGHVDAYRRRRDKKGHRDIKLAGELIAANLENDECKRASEVVDVEENLTSGFAGSVAGDAKSDVMSLLSGDAVSVQDAVSNIGASVVGADDDDYDDENDKQWGFNHSVAMSDDKHSAVPTVLRYKYRMNRRKSCCDKLLEVADWDNDSRRLCSLAFLYSAQGVLGKFFSLLDVALISHFVGIREANAFIMVETLFGFTGILVAGFEEALGLLVPQAHGADNNIMVGRYLQLVIVIYNIMQIPAGIIWGLWTYDAIIWFGYDDKTAEIGQQYAYTVIIYMVVEAIDECLWTWLEVVGHARYATIYSISAHFVETGAFVALLAFGVTDLFLIGLADAAVGVVVVVVNIVLIVSMGWLNEYWVGLVQTNGFKDQQALRNVISVAIPSAIAWFLSYGEWELLSVFARRMGPAEVSTWNLLGYLWGAFEVLTNGFASAAEVRVGFRMGANKPEQAKFMAEKGMYVTTVVAVFQAGLIFCIAQYIPAWITPDPTLQLMMFQLFPLVGFGSVLMVTGMVAWSIVTATGRVKLATMWEVIITWGITIPGSAIMVFVFNFNLEAMTAAMIFGYCVAANLYLFILLRTDWAKQAKRVQARNQGGAQYLDADWNKLPKQTKAAAITLGYNKQLWESNEEPASNKKSWDELTPAEQSAAAAFGYSRRKWDSPDGSSTNSSDDDSSSSSDSNFEDYKWSDLPEDVRKAAVVLGYNQAAWNADKKVATSSKSWNQLTSQEQEAARVLRYTKAKWDD